MTIPRLKEPRQAYGFEEVAIVPGDMTINPDQTNIDLEIGNIQLTIPIMAAAMDAIVSPKFATLMSQLGGLGIMNLEGLYSRYENPQDAIDRIAESPPENTTTLLQEIYSKPINENLIGARITEIVKGGKCAVSVTPQNAKKLAPVAVEAGADIIVVQSTVTTARHASKSYRGLIFSELIDA